jgi:hypothetical protein
LTAWVAVAGGRERGRGRGLGKGAVRSAAGNGGGETESPARARTRREKSDRFQGAGRVTRSGKIFINTEKCRGQFGPR